MNKTISSNSLLDYGEEVQTNLADTSEQATKKAPASTKKRVKKENTTLLKIGEVATLFEINTSVLRFWEDEFEQLNPERTEKGQRLYSTKDIALIKKIKKLLHVEGLTIEGAKKSLAKGQLPKGRQDVRPKLGNIPTLSLHKGEKTSQSQENLQETNRAAKILQQALNVQKAKNAKEREEEVLALQAIHQELLAIKAMLTK